jgi:acetyl-CoA carboxylase/biotin carboxylase 1
MTAHSNGTAPTLKSHLNGTVPSVNGRSSYAAKHKLADHFIGGNRLENAVAGPVKDFVANHDGHTVITNVGTCASSPPTTLTALPHRS